MNKKNHGRSNDVEEDDHNRQARDIGKNQKKWHQRMGSDTSTRKEQWIVMGKRWDCIHGRKNVCSKQQEAQRKDPIRESQLSGCGTSRTTEDARIDQTKLLVARTRKRHQEIHTRIF